MPIPLESQWLDARPTMGEEAEDRRYLASFSYTEFLQSSRSMILAKLPPFFKQHKLLPLPRLLTLYFVFATSKNVAPATKL